MGDEVIYTLVANGKDYGTITRDEVWKGRAYDSVVSPMIEQLANANRIASELFYDFYTKNYFDECQREQEFLSLLESLNKALLINKE